LAMVVLGTPFRVACDTPEMTDSLQECFGAAFYKSDWKGLLDSGHYHRMRAIGSVPDDAWEYTAQHVRVLDNSPVLDHPRVEGLKYAMEQSLSVDFHRYGHLGLKELD